MGKTAKRTLGGVIAEMGLGFACKVRLASGEAVPARIPRHVARLMFRVVPGDRVAVEQRSPGPFVVLGHERTVIDARCAAELTRDGRPLADWFLIGELICFWSGHGDIGELLSSDDGWYAHIRDYLRRVCAPEYGSHAEALRARAKPGAAADRPRG